MIRALWLKCGSLPIWAMEVYGKTNGEKMISLDECIKNITSVAISGHVRPDGDCSGSCLAVYNYICDNYPDMDVFLYLEPIQDKFSFLKYADRIRDAALEDQSRVFDLFIALDCGDLGRLGKAGHFFETARRTVCVDHHVTNQSFADVNYVFPHASSTCELVYQLMDKEKLTKEIAECLYLGIVHDTGVFQYSCTSSKTMQIAGELMDKGINYPKIVDETYYIKSYAEQRIWGKAMMNSELCLDGRCIYSIITKADMDQYQVTPKELDGIVSQLRSTIGVEVSVFLYETDDGYKISLRSASFVDVAKIASGFGGGGHARAAGASSGEAPEVILKTLLSGIRAQLSEGLCTTEL